MISFLTKCTPKFVIYNSYIRVKCIVFILYLQSCIKKVIVLLFKLILSYICNLMDANDFTIVYEVFYGYI